MESTFHAVRDARIKAIRLFGKETGSWKPEKMLISRVTQVQAVRGNRQFGVLVCGLSPGCCLHAIISSNGGAGGGGTHSESAFCFVFFVFIRLELFGGQKRLVFIAPPMHVSGHSPPPALMYSIISTIFEKRRSHKELSSPPAKFERGQGGDPRRPFLFA